MRSNQDALYWSLLYSLVTSHEYELSHYSEEEQEAWLEAPNRDRMVRLKRQDTGCSNCWVCQDLEKANALAEKLWKTKRKSKQIYNVYISNCGPVDDWKEAIEQARKSARIRTIFCTEDHVESLEEFLKNALRMNAVHLRELRLLMEEPPESLRFRFLQTIWEREQQREKILNYAPPILTKVFIGLQIFMFVMLEWFGGSQNTRILIEFGAKYNPLIIEGEWWRFFTPIFLHIGFLHLTLNTIALFYIGSQVERILGNIRFLIVYLFAGFCGSLLSFVMSDSVSAGASGAIFGCFGSLMYIVLSYGKVFPKTVLKNVLTLIGVNLLFGFIVPGVDNAGHIGGLIGGFLVTVIVNVPKQRSSLLKRGGALFVVFLFITALLLYGYSMGSSRHFLLY